MTQATMKCRKRYRLFSLLSWLCTFLPILIYSVTSITIQTVNPSSKLVMGVCLFGALIAVAINLLFKYRIRCIIWILLLGITLCLDNIQSLLVIMTITTVLDQFVFEPLTHRYKEKYHINKEMDLRENGNK